MRGRGKKILIVLLMLMLTTTLLTGCVDWPWEHEAAGKAPYSDDFTDDSIDWTDSAAVEEFKKVWKDWADGLRDPHHSIFCFIVDTMVEAKVENTIDKDTIAILDSESLNNPKSPKYAMKQHAEGLMDALAVAGQLLCFAFFLIELADLATRESFTLEMFVKALGKLFVMCYVYNNLGTLFNWLIELDNAVLSAVEPHANDFSASVLRQKLIDTHDDLFHIPEFHFGEAISYGYEFWLNSYGDSGGLMRTFVNIALDFVTYTRLFEMMLYTAFLPLGTASMYSGGFHSSGLNYLKRLVAVVLQGGIIMMVFGLYMKMIELNFGPTISLCGCNMGKGILTGALTIGVLMKSRKIAQEIVGVR